MRVFKSKWFVKFARKERITDEMLREAVLRVERGFVDADYGGGVIKQRLARPNAGKSGGYRTILLFRRGERCFFVYGFAKNDRDNIDHADEQEFKDLAKIALLASDAYLQKLVYRGDYEEITYDAEDEKIQKPH